MKEIYLKNTAVLAGISAGAMCWFNCGHSDSEIFWSDGEIGYGWINNLLNIYQYVYCPHYEQRKASFDEMLQEKELSGLAMESDTAFVERNGKISYIKCNKSSNAYILRFNNGKLAKEQIELELLE
ncbi:MAG: peptidase E [Butyrivibrio sp.]|nr:peptidase E [Butyrivibrio sp.]